MPIKYQSEEILHPFLFFLKKKKSGKKILKRKTKTKGKEIFGFGDSFIHPSSHA
jgi:hypothetical protein